VRDYSEGRRFLREDAPDHGRVFRDRSPEKCRELAAESLSSLKPDGRIIVHEVLSNSSKTRPLATASMSMVTTATMAWAQGQQFAVAEPTTPLRDAGFPQIQTSEHSVTGARDRTETVNGWRAER